jgi:hypothetical protein
VVSTSGQHLSVIEFLSSRNIDGANPSTFDRRAIRSRADLEPRSHPGRMRARQEVFDAGENDFEDKPASDVGSRIQDEA